MRLMRFRRNGEVDQGETAVERFGVMGDQFALKPEAADPLEQYRPPDALRQPRGIAEAKTSVADRAIAQRIDKLPQITASGVVAEPKHGSDGRPPTRAPKNPS